jgi:hypothetical protein
MSEKCDKHAVPVPKCVIVTVALLVVVGLEGCRNRAVSPGRGPYADYLPQSAPSETNRVKHPAGFSIVSPPGWRTRTIPIEDYLKGRVADQFVVEGTQQDTYRPKITIQRLGPEAYDQWESFL